MYCPNCKSVLTSVKDTRALDDVKWRRRRCKTCEYVFWTVEAFGVPPAKLYTLAAHAPRRRREPRTPNSGPKRV